MSEKDRAEVALLITKEIGKPATIDKVEECDFFNSHNNTFEGYYAWIKYSDGRWEIWFIVDMRSSIAADDWFIEKIT